MYDDACMYDSAKSRWGCFIRVETERLQAKSRPGRYLAFLEGAEGWPIGTREVGHLTREVGQLIREVGRRRCTFIGISERSGFGQLQ